MNRRKWAGLILGATLALGSAQLLAVSAARAQDASPEDKEKALKYLESTKKKLMEATHGLSDAQWNFKPAPDKWSCAEVMEHLAAAEDFIRGNITENVMKAPAVPGLDSAKTDAAIIANVPDRTNKIQAPEPIKPTNRFGSPEGSIKHFLDSRTTTEEFLKKTSDLRGHVTDGPVGGKWDAYEWVLLIAAHTERHTKQIEEVKANPNFPKS
jgi:hypothetical protein